jgi:hypothetical protein
LCPWEGIFALYCFWADTCCIGAGRDVQNIVITEAMQKPEATLQPGSYSLSIEDRLKDRAVVRVSNLNSKQHFLCLR